MKFKLLNLTLLFLIFSTPCLAEDINLNEELSPKVNHDQVEIRDYKHADGAKITEYKSGGKVWMIKVEPGGDFPAYYLYDDEGHGLFERRIMGNKQPPAPMWIIKKF
ncbi:MAG: DUF2782 domain-containing protein [Ghiorsea sp.]